MAQVTGSTLWRSSAVVALVLVALAALPAVSPAATPKATPFPTPIHAASPQPLPRTEYWCVRIISVGGFATSQLLADAIADGSAVVVSYGACAGPNAPLSTAAPVPTATPDPTPAPTVTPRPRPTATPLPAWTKYSRSLSYRWVDEYSAPCDDGWYCWTLDVRADRPCPRGVRAWLGDLEDGDYVTAKMPKGTGTARVQVRTLEAYYPSDEPELECLQPPQTVTMRGYGDEDRYFNMHEAWDVRGTVSVSSPTSYGCVFYSYIDGEPIDEFDLSFSGHRTKVRHADVSEFFYSSGRYRLKVLSTCNWTLTFVGTGE